MARNGISPTRAGFSKGRPRKLGPRAQARPYDPSASLSDPGFVQKAILQALREGDFEAVVEIYRAHLRVLNRTHAAKALQVSRQYVHKMLQPFNTPSLRTFASFMRLLAQEAAAR